MVDGGGSCVGAMAYGTGALAGSHVHFRSDRLTNRLPRRAPLEYSRSAGASCSTASSTSAERPHEVLSATNGLSNRTPFRARVDTPSIRPIKRAHWKNPVRAKQLGPPDGATLAWRRYSTTGAERKAKRVGPHTAARREIARETSSPSHVCLRGIGCPVLERRARQLELGHSDLSTAPRPHALARLHDRKRRGHHRHRAGASRRDRPQGCDRGGLPGAAARYQVRWEVGRTSILAPSAGSARIEQTKRPRAKAKA
jgi:hypothetical protein